MGALDGYMATWLDTRLVKVRSRRVPNSTRVLNCASCSRRSRRPNRDPSGPVPRRILYDTTNQKQNRVLGETAVLDQKLRSEVDRAAAVVTAGRRDLDAVRQWVVNAASPRGTSGPSRA